MQWHCRAAHRWKGAAGGNFFRVYLRRRSNSERNSAPSAFIGPRVSKAMGTNTRVAGNHAYLAVLRTAACSAAEPDEIAVCDKYDAAQVWTTVASQAMYLPAVQGMSVAPSGSLPSEDQMVPSCLEHLHSAVNAK